MTTNEIKVVIYGIGPIGERIAKVVLGKKGMKIVGAVDISSITREARVVLIKKGSYGDLHCANLRYICLVLVSCIFDFGMFATALRKTEKRGVCG